MKRTSMGNTAGFLKRTVPFRHSVFSKVACFVLVCLGLLPPLSQAAYFTTVNGVEWGYTLDGNLATVTGAEPAKGKLTIPSSLDGHPVVSVRYSAFRGCTGLTAVTIPNSVKNIGSSAFSGCSALTSVKIPGSVTKIEMGAFDRCPDILFDTTSIPGVRLVDGWAVGYMASIPHNVDLSGIRGLAEDTFFQCTRLVSVKIPNAVTYIGYYTFFGCNSLSSVTIPDSVTYIGHEAFRECSELRSVTIPNSVTNIGIAAFRSCTALTSLTIPESVTTIGGRALAGCNALKTLYVPASWRGTGMLTSAEVPSGCTVVYVVEHPTVAFDANGGSCGTASKTYTFGKPYGSLPAASWNGHAFLGWFTQASGGTRVTAQSSVPGTESQTLYAHWEEAEEPLKVWRFYSEKNKGHFFTIGEAEKTQLLTTSLTWTFQGGAYRAYKAKTADTVPLYRFYSEKYKGHFFTRSEAEKNSLVATSKTWKYQGIAFYVYPKAGAGRIPVYRFWSDSYGHHFYTASEAEKNNLVATSKTWKYQGIAFWAEPLDLAKATVNFNANGGSCGTASKTYTSGKVFGALPAATRNGQAFLGWFTATSGGTRMTPQSTVTGTATQTLYAHWEEAEEPLKVWRFYSEKNKGHFFTIGEAEKTQLLTTSPTWSFQGGAYRAYKTQVEGTVPLYRFYSESYKGHFFTRNEKEKNNLVATSKTWKYEGIAYYVYPGDASGRIPVYRFWSDSYRHHFYTANEAEKDSLVATSKTWKYQGIAFWALPVDYKSGSRTLTVHDKDKPNWSVPVAGYYCDAYQKCEMVYPAAELGAMKGTTITGMTFYATQADMVWGGKCRVFLKEVSGKTISAFSGSGTVVYEGILRIANNKLVVSFSTPYAYKGGNLLVGVYRTVKGSGGVSSKWVGEQVAGASISGYNYTSLSSVTPTQRDFLPKTTFAYEVGVTKTAAKAGAVRQDVDGAERAGMTVRGEENIRLSSERVDAEVTTSDGTDGSAAADGDEGTAWVPQFPEAGSWLVLTFDEPIEVAEVTVVGENLPEETRVLLSEDAETWFEGEGGTAQYVWVAIPPVAEGLKVREIWVEEEGE